MRLLVATRNAHKLDELRAMLVLPGVRLIGADALPGAPDVVEDQDSFEGNAIKKARELGAYSGLWTLADDSGLEVNVLGGAPGVYSARYAGEPADPSANNRKLLAALEGKTDRCARFRCVVALRAPDGAIYREEGCCEGVIAEVQAGERGFGYDPLFIPAGNKRTFAEMTAEAKHALSHRGRAMARAREAWTGLILSARDAATGP